MIRVLELGSMVGSLLRCCLTCSRYWRLWFCLLMMVAILPRAALFSCLHLQELIMNIIRISDQVLPVERITKLQEPDVVLGHVVNEVPGCVCLTQSKLVVIFVIENIHQIRIERMDVFQLGKVLQD